MDLFQWDGWIILVEHAGWFRTFNFDLIVI